MPPRLKLVKGATRKAVLVYGMRLFDHDQLDSVGDALVHLKDGSAGRVTMHVIEGTPAQIRNQLMRSLDAFFELLDEK